MNYFYALLAAVLVVLSGSARGQIVHQNLYQAAVANSRVFSEMIRAAGLAQTFSKPYNGTLFIPTDESIYHLATELNVVIDLKDKDQCKDIVLFHVLPNDFLTATVPQKLVKTALKPWTLDIALQSQTRKFTITYYKGTTGIAFPSGTKFTSRVIKARIPIASSIGTARAALVDRILYPVKEFAKGKTWKRLKNDDVCEYFNGNGTSTQCGVLAAFERSYYANGLQERKCSDVLQALPTVELNTLQDLRPLPSTINLSSVSDTEGASMYWLYRMLENVASWATCKEYNGAADLKLPQGWRVMQAVDFREGTKYFFNKVVPFATLLANDDKKHLALLVRRQITAYEWKSLYAYNRTYTHAAIFPGPTHDGITQAFRTVWERVQPTFEEAIFENKTFDKVTIAGHSIGGSVAELIGYATESFLRSLNSTQANVTLDVVTFGASNVAGKEFKQAYNEIVNGRHVSYSGDAVSQVPCAEKMPTCGASLFNYKGFPVPTNTPKNARMWEYLPAGAAISFGPSDLVSKDKAWSKFTYVPFQHIHDMKTATQDCSYMCYFSKYDAKNNGDSCLLKNTKGAGTICPSFIKAAA